MSLTIDDILPFLKNLTERLHYTPTQDELKLMKQANVREMRLFYDALATGMPDRELFDKIMYYLHLREKGEHGNFKMTGQLPPDKQKLSKGMPAAVPAPASGKKIPAPASSSASKAATMAPANRASSPGNNYNRVSSPTGTHNNNIPVAMQRARQEKKTVEGEIEINVEPQTFHYNVTVNNTHTKHTTAVRLNFSGSDNIRPKASTTSGKGKQIDSNTVEVVVAPGDSLTAAKLEPISMTEPTSYRYTVQTQLRESASGSGGGSNSTSQQRTTTSSSNSTGGGGNTSSSNTTTTKMATNSSSTSSPPKTVAPPEDDDSGPAEKKYLAEGLDVLISNVNHGYHLEIINSHPTANYNVVMDFAESSNLKFDVIAPATMSGPVLNVTVPRGQRVPIIDMPVDNFDLCSCEMRYKASIRKQ